jgi:hypothetical protein
VVNTRALADSFGGTSTTIYAHAAREEQRKALAGLGERLQ